ncbi:hypothetical protein SAMN05421856_102547 [Chryseobacterium taichungense]|uniref:Uncharacterized protein n=1 Tax=Chryseobacterium taichungense TaxID=295069 RepID=A0A1H7XMQ5_9FLAO|nr:hypothetical protein SAMN05421856_102547 [Chryseobacterium taichungense]
MWYTCGMLGFNLFIIYQFKVTYLIMIYGIWTYLIFVILTTLVVQGLK